MWSAATRPEVGAPGAGNRNIAARSVSCRIGQLINLYVPRNKEMKISFSKSCVGNVLYIPISPLMHCLWSVIFEMHNS